MIALNHCNDHKKNSQILIQLCTTDGIYGNFADSVGNFKHFDSSSQ